MSVIHPSFIHFDVVENKSYMLLFIHEIQALSLGKSIKILTQMSIFSLILILELSLEVLILVYNLVNSPSWLAVVTSYVIHFLRLTSQVYHQQSLSLSKVLELLRLNRWYIELFLLCHFVSFIAGISKEQKLSKHGIGARIDCIWLELNKQKLSDKSKQRLPN